MMRFFQDHKNKKLLSVLGNALFFLFCAAILFLSLRGLPGNPTIADLNTPAWKDEGPFELSPERGRFALLYTIVENKSFSFPPDLARFVAPDVAYHPTRGYVSLFAPGLSFSLIPGYIIGRMFGDAQVGSVAVVVFFALLNTALIRLIAIRLGANPLAATIAAFAFLFGSPAFAYAVTLYQHHLSLFLILSGIYLLVRFNSIFSLMIIWILCGFSIMVDYPNFFMMLPIGVTAFFKVFSFKKNEHSTVLNFSFLRLFSIASIILPLLFFFWSNMMSYGNPFQLAGALPAISKIAPDGKPIFGRVQVDSKQTVTPEPQTQEAENQKSVIGFFKTRNLMNGFYIHFLSPDRGMITYTPIMFFGFLGIILALKRKLPFTALLVAVVGFNVLLYSMWGDPYGGWAFGSRYLVPTYAILSIFIAFLLTFWRKYLIFLLFFFIILSYSLAVNTLGAITSSKNPPQIEAIGLEKLSHVKEEYTYMRNVNMLNSDGAKSYFFQTYARSYLSAWNYYSYLIGAILGVAILLLVILKVDQRKGGQNAV